MKIGFEIHQQLETHKLFCSSPSMLREDEAEFQVRRRLRPTQSELGVVDEAAMKEFLKGKSFVYKGYNDSICLVELDEEPPRGPNQEAVEIAISIALLLNAEIVDEIHFMRKVVIDGSNTSGFQRTAVIAFDGYIDTEDGRINIPTICLEEEAARKVRDDEQATVFNLDRLGIPLIEITTAPDIKSPGQAREGALKVGELLRATGKVKRGIGTIRQDINVSTKGGARVEVKGVQDLNTIQGIIKTEVERQEGLKAIKKELESRGVKAGLISESIHDVTEVFRNTASKVIKGQLEEGKVLAVKLPKFRGLLGGGLLGREMARSVKVHAGVRGIFHSDELPSYGITEGEVEAVEKKLNNSSEDAFVLVAERIDKARSALQVVLERARLSLKGPLEETRMAVGDKSSYLRPLPGAARMYPETDIPPFVVSGSLIEGLRKNLPETFEMREERIAAEHGLGRELSRQLARSPAVLSVFEEVAPNLSSLSTSGAASICLDWRRDVETGGVEAEALKQFLLAVDEDAVAKEASQEIRAEVKQGKTVEKVLKHRRGESVDVERIVDSIIREKSDLILEKGMMAQKPLMGLVMKEVRGKVDGGSVNQLLRKKIEEFLSNRR